MLALAVSGHTGASVSSVIGKVCFLDIKGGPQSVFATITGLSIEEGYALFIALSPSGSQISAVIMTDDSWCADTPKGLIPTEFKVMENPT